MRPVVFIGFITVIHFVVSFALFMYVIGMGLPAFDEFRPRTASESLIDGVATVVLAPFSLVGDAIPHDWFPGRSFFVVLVANSLIWGLLAYALLVAYRRWRISRHAG
ncbi:MAG: hypothetical protein OES25_13910 [Acidobacteriota bacterium]|nr:hypothetical protein [Acidobacteriota bacterium]